MILHKTSLFGELAERHIADRTLVIRGHGPLVLVFPTHQSAEHTSLFIGDSDQAMPTLGYGVVLRQIWYQWGIANICKIKRDPLVLFKD